MHCNIHKYTKRRVSSKRARPTAPSYFDKQDLAFNFWNMNTTMRNPTRSVQIGRTTIGGDHPIAVQSMAATRTQDTEATTRQLRLLAEAGADVIRVAVDSKKDVEALAQIAPTVDVPLSVDLQENYRLVRSVAPHVEKIRYNPGHLYHHEKDKPVADKVAFIADEAAKHDCALRVGVNCGSVDPAQAERFPDEDSISPMIASALEHCELLDALGFTRYCVSLKDSDPAKVIAANTRFAQERPDVPLGKARAFPCGPCSRQLECLRCRLRSQHFPLPHSVIRSRASSYSPSSSICSCSCCGPNSNAPQPRRKNN